MDMDLYKKSVETRLVRRLQVNAQTGCWEYQGFKPRNARGLKGYGRQYVIMGLVLPDRKRRFALVHRVAAWLRMGVELDGPHEICHGCDNKLCCSPNPGHMRIGTRSENLREAYERGLQPRDRGNGKLNKKKVAQIRKLYATGRYSQTQLAKAAGITQQQVSMVVRRKNWK